jgi:hypothetical protein
MTAIDLKSSNQYKNNQNTEVYIGIADSFRMNDL